MNRTITQPIEFFGGPIDGHVEQFVKTPKPFVLVATAAHAQHTNPWVILYRVFAFHEQVESRLWAVYELQYRGLQPYYNYLRSSLETNVDVDSQHVERLSRSKARLRPE